ncbi:MAG: hypothetical protein DCC75_04195 [Proteobacteria bacterium]|nr:MAG: hypothetical protein DCC75_04195 [Pseudomonadota bacterium]
MARQREKLSPEEQSEIIEAFRLQNGGKHPLTFFDQQRHYKVGDDSRYVRASIAEMLAQWERVGYCPPISDFGVRERSKVLGEERPSKEQRMLVHALYAALHEHNRIIQAVIPRDTYKNNGEIFNALNNQIKQGGRDPMEVYDCMEKIFNKQGRIGVAEAVSVLDARLRALPQEGNGVVHVGNSAIAMFAKAGLNTDQAMVQIYGEEAIQLCRTILDAGSPEEIATARQAADDKTYRLACYYAEVNGELLTPKVSLALHAVDQ